mmetsp:Transcript_105323/g.235012  ORF Transcript_105323/g.235012 Transcript_105323/m.235012 type:complete len:398 (-) Transcript_105323:34-1227(-)
MKFFVGIFIPGVFAIQVKKEGSASSALDAGDVLVTSPHDDHDGNITFSKTPPFGPWECYAELDFPTTWYEYCDAPSPKSFSMTDKCAHASWSSGLGSGATMAALSDCTHKTGLFGDKCYTYDNNGKNCHQRYCIPSDVNSFEWANYCTIRSKNKAWFQSQECTAYGWADESDAFEYQQRLTIAQQRCEMRSGNKTCFLVDDGGSTRGPQCMPTCAQDASSSCWATAAAQVATFFEPRKFPYFDAESCVSNSCQVASAVDHRTCCTSTENSGLQWNKACDHVNYMGFLSKWLLNNTGQDYKDDILLVPSESELRSMLERGPVVIMVHYWASWLINMDFAHFITIAGTNDQGDFWVTNSQAWHQIGNGFSARTYDQIRHYKAPDADFDAEWIGTFYIKG